MHNTLWYDRLVAFDVWQKERIWPISFYSLKVGFLPFICLEMMEWANLWVGWERSEEDFFWRAPVVLFLGTYPLRLVDTEQKAQCLQFQCSWGFHGTQEQSNLLAGSRFSLVTSHSHREASNNAASTHPHSMRLNSKAQGGEGMLVVYFLQNSCDQWMLTKGYSLHLTMRHGDRWAHGVICLMLKTLLQPITIWPPLGRLLSTVK